MHIDKDNYWHTLPRPGSFTDWDEDDDSNYGEEGHRRHHMLREVAETILLTLLIFFVVRSVVQNFKVEGESMMPTLYHDQYLLVNKGLYFRYDANFLNRMFDSNAEADMRYLFHGPQRGDIVVFQAWDQPRDFIKRVIAVEGETVEVKPEGGPSIRQDEQCDSGCCDTCAVYVNEVKLNEPYINERPNYKRAPLIVPPGHVYVLGDNRPNSSDSHANNQGPLPIDHIIGAAFISYWPQHRWGLIPHPTYAEMEKP